MNTYLILANILWMVDNKWYPKEWRKGQAVFNICSLFFTLEVEQLRGTDYDCFHKDDRIEGFIKELGIKLNT